MSKHTQPRRPPLIPGDKFGKLTVVHNMGLGMYLVVCECGNFKKQRGQNLTKGKAISCGCLNSLYLKQTRLPEDDLEHAHNLICKYVEGTYRYYASARGYVYELGFNHFKKLIFSDCIYCSTKPFNFSTKVKTKTTDKVYYNGVDRVDNSIGYTIDNSVSCCRRCNSAKNNKSKEEFLEWASRVYNTLKNKGELS